MQGGCILYGSSVRGRRRFLGRVHGMVGKEVYSSIWLFTPRIGERWLESRFVSSFLIQELKRDGLESVLGMDLSSTVNLHFIFESDLLLQIHGLSLLLYLIFHT